MSKVTKLLRNPLAFLQDAASKRFGWKFGKKGSGKKKPKVGIPPWFQTDPGPELRRMIKGSKPLFLYIPWIAEHGDMLIGRIGDTKNYNLAPLDFIRGAEDNDVRRSVLNFARATPHIYRRMIARRLVPLRGRVSGLIFTFDWAPVMRIIAGVCEELEIPRILIPHESVFVDRDKYYWDPTAHASIPVADVILGWGGLQREIFVERGYPAHRFKSVGAPKFDPYKNYQPRLSRNQYCRLFGLDPARKIILFASQPLDSQLDIQVARKSQCDAITDLLDFAEAKGLQLIVRLPPSKDNILEFPLQKRIEQSPAAAIDDALCYLVSPEEALYHADLVTSVNSTMLFEGLLIGRPALSVKYVAFDSIWAAAGIPAANNKDELIARMDKMLFSAEPWQPSPQGLAWAAKMFSNGDFDGRAHVRIKNYLRRLALGENRLTLRPGGVERILTRHTDEGKVNIVSSPLTDEAWAATYQHLLPLLNAKSHLNSAKGLSDVRKLASVDVFFQWGPKPHLRQAEVQAALGRQRMVVDHGFLRAPQGGELSIWLDDTTNHNDATRPSRLQRLLESDLALTEEQLERSRKLIQKITLNRLSVENNLPPQPLTLGTPGRKKTLVADQRAGDETLLYSLADAASFSRMLQHAALDPEREIILLYPPASVPPVESHLSEVSCPEVKNLKNLPVKTAVNPWPLLDLADEVCVVNSLLGFDALLAGKTVHCFGAPFYAGWGITIDHLPIPGRTRRRSLEEIFYFALIECSRYFHPGLNRVVEIEDFLDWLISGAKQDPSALSGTPTPQPSLTEAPEQDEETDFERMEEIERDELNLPRQSSDPDLTDPAEETDFDLPESAEEADFDLTEPEEEAEAGSAEKGESGEGKKKKWFS